MAGIYISAGLFHFIKPEFYIRIIPPYLPGPRLLVFLSGIAEVVLGIGLLLPETRSLAAWSIILMLLAFMPVHIYMLQSERFRKLPRWALWVRLPLQGVLMYWAYLYV